MVFNIPNYMDNANDHLLTTTYKNYCYCQLLWIIARTPQHKHIGTKNVHFCRLNITFDNIIYIVYTEIVRGGRGGVTDTNISERSYIIYLFQPLINH